MMKTTDLILCLLDASGGRIRGRTLLHKLVFFTAELVDLEIDFIPHYYGPYSPTLDAAVSQLKSLGFIEEVPQGFGAVDAQGFEIKRYDYRITDDGLKVVERVKNKQKEEYERIVRTRQRIEEAGDLNYLELSVAAKAFFILTQKNKPMTRPEIVEKAKTFDWNIPPDSLEKAVTFLEKLGLTKKQ